VGRFQTVATRVNVFGASLLVIGSSLVLGVVAQSLTSPAFADTSPYETFCTGTPLGNIVLNDVVLTGTMSPASPTVGQQFNVTGLQTHEQLPATIAQAAAATGLTALTGTIETTVDVTGATPPSISTGPMAFDVPIPNPVPPSGLALDVPSTPATVGPFTATSANITVSSDAVRETTTIDGAGIGLLSLHCASYPNNALPSGFTNDIPPGVPISPVITTAGQVTTPPPSPTTGPYELYCPHTPVGDLVFNDVTTSATISPATLAAGDQFQVSGYQTDIPIPPGAVTAAVGLGNAGFNGLAASYVDAYGATPSQRATGSMGFDVPIPNPVPSSGLTLNIPASPATVGPFTASGGPITIAQDQSILVVAELSGKAFKMSCTAYPNDSIATSGSTNTAPGATPIRPIVATGTASGTPVTTTTTTFQPGGPGPGNQKPGAPYELYCARTPVGDIAVNDVVTTASITPTSLNEGDRFQITNLQTQFTIPQSVAQQAENLGLTTLSGDLSLFLNVTGTQFNGFPGPVVGVASAATTTTTSSTATTSSSSSPIQSGPPIVLPPFPGPFPGVNDMSFDVTLPSPVPTTGVQFTATEAAGSQPESFVAAGGPIQVFASGVNLNVSAFGDRFGLFCDTLANNTVPTGLSIREPFSAFFNPLITTGSATTIPPPPTPPGAPGAYELFCPGTPVGNIALNNVDTTGTITPPDPASGVPFNLTGYQTTLTIPASIASAAAALGNTAITGTATGSVDAVGATPAQISTGAMNIDVPLPSPIPPTGVSLTLPTPAGTIGPFTASGGAITLAEDARVQLVLIVSGSQLTLHCSAYPNNTEPTGIVSSFPPGSPTSPVIATTGAPPPTPVPTTSPSEPGVGPTTTQPLAPVTASTDASASPSSTTTASSPADSSGSTGSVSSTTGAPATKASSLSSDPPGSGPASTAAPVVRASSSSLAFTGPGAATGWIVVAGAAMILVGIAMLALADGPRRLRWVLAGRGGAGGGRLGVAPRLTRPQEALWVGDIRRGEGPRYKR
jgi:hypothetical protein